MSSKDFIKNKISALEKAMLAAANEEIAGPMSAYMKKKFPFLGIKKPERELIVKPWMEEMKKLDWEDARKASAILWKKKEREYQYIAMELLFKNKKSWNESSLDYFESLVIEKSWWDTVDFIASNLIGNYFLKHPEKMHTCVKKWSSHKNMWLNRTAIIFQIKYRKQTDTDLLLHAIFPHINSNEFFLQKAIGWALRAYSETEPSFVWRFVETNELKPLSKREATRKID
ncbi:MAG: DNA alkylation repair protein [Bacteroidetes bacterium]|nr:MAG: DNA alkylation repair protein [Bacteroidota bacterium]REK07585.1 MAG: DNA alkylation repair protein [Bacteroidota bacterium]REK36982.1 MAG: DNA alkylation repair protein [Bacteroidota bacterium]REK47803.1 MAG: DNA alkylation repair protein [Bacteroidota bacterium]